MRQFQTGSRIGVFAFFFITVAVRADVVHLRDGQVLENVRTELRGGVLFVSPPGGAVQRIPVDRVLRIEPGPVRVPPTSPVVASEPTQSVAAPQIANRERAAAGRRRESRQTPESGAALSPVLAASGAQPTPVLDPPADSPSARAFQDAAPIAQGAESAEEAALAHVPPSRGRLFLEGLAPGWSGLHRRGDAAGYAGGAFLGALELYLAYYVVLFHQPPATSIANGFYQDPNLFVDIGASQLGVVSLNEAAPGLGTYVFVATVSRVNGLVRHPINGDRWMTRGQFQTFRNNYLAAFAGTLLLDGVLSAIYGRPESEQGADLRPRYDGVDVAFTLRF